MPELVQTLFSRS